MRQIYSLHRCTDTSQYDSDLPRFPCNGDEVCCPNCLLPIPFPVNPNQSPLLLSSNSDDAPEVEVNGSLIADQTKAKPTSRAQSVASTKTSHSAKSTHSARYSVKLRRRISANSRRHSIESKASKTRMSSRRSISSKIDGRAEYFRCPIADCPEIFVSMPAVRAHERSLHYPTHCTFCDRSFNCLHLWRLHEQVHLDEHVLVSLSDMLWRCGICDTYGLGESRRYLHIRRHWEDGLPKEAWKYSYRSALVMPLTARDTEIMLNMPEEEFILISTYMVGPTSFKSPTTSRAVRNFLNESVKRRQRQKPAYPQQETEFNKTEDDESPDQVTMAVESSQSMIHGLFAFIRKSVPRLKLKPP